MWNLVANVVVMLWYLSMWTQAAAKFSMVSLTLAGCSALAIFLMSLNGFDFTPNDGTDKRL